MKHNTAGSFFLFCCFLLLFFTLSMVVSAHAFREDEMRIRAASALLVDAEYGEILYEQDARAPRYPASITKIMTALLSIEAIARGACSLEDLVTVNASALTGLSVNGTSQDMKSGEVVFMRDLLHCVLVASANDSCNVLAEWVSGNIPDFISLMNARALELGCTGTVFVNTHGLHDPDHVTTAYDTYLIAREAMEHPLFRSIVKTDEYRVPATNLSPERHFLTTNHLISHKRIPGYTYRYAVGIKTGSTPEAGNCLVSCAVKGDRTLFSVVLGAEDIQSGGRILLRESFSESRRLLEWGFSDFSRRTVLDSSMLLAELPVSMSRVADYVVAHPSESLELTVPRALDLGSLERVLDFYEPELTAPVEKGQALGTVTIRYGGKPLGTVGLSALSSVPRSELMHRIQVLRGVTGSIWFRAAAVLLVFVLVLFVLRAHIRGRRRVSRRSGRVIRPHRNTWRQGIRS